ncbi:Cation/H+ exchanger [Protomyces lactucae-debilis]|uniref:Cation/H+ exchanger n=1 Tax=Protomyces lactucae-debilis TaxID=2754530 RepID=A0A1Y2FTZ6_PROLT|nr:Cation/H+ exchanger [Protomyces lactucae-debilis]ORY86165.1 Cation/H+ exchanger [Protomyces lactucae-debilis]
MSSSFFEYHEPSIEQILILIAFFVALGIFTAAFEQYAGIGLLGQILVGGIFGTPLSNILAEDWLSTFLALGYLGLIGLVFEGGLSSRLDLLFANLGISTICAATGILAPIALSILFIHIVFGYTLLEGFIAGAALSATSLGTTFTVLKGATIDLRNARIGTVLSSAAVIDDVVALVLAQVITSLGGSDGSPLGWVIGRPVLSALGLALVTVPLSWLLRHRILPALRQLRSTILKLLKITHGENLAVMTILSSVWISIAAYAGTSILLGAYLAGVMVNYLDLTTPPAKLSHRATNTELDTHRVVVREPSFAETFEHRLGVAQTLGSWFFFASIGYCIPIRDLWQGTLVWQGIVYSNQHGSCLKRGIWPGILLGSGMVARGEIGLLIIQLGIVTSGKVSKEVFIVAIWAILLNTIVGPIAVRLVARYKGDAIMGGHWGFSHATL